MIHYCYVIVFLLTYNQTVFHLFTYPNTLYNLCVLVGQKDVGVVHIEEDANCISKVARTIDKVRKKATPSIPPVTMGRPPPKERGPPAKSTRKAKVTVPEVISFKSMAACMAEALLKCQQFKRAKVKNGEGKKRVKLTPEEKLRRLIPRQAAAMARRTAKVREYEAARDARRAAKGPVKNPGKYKKDKGFWTKDAKAARKAAWDAGYDGRMERKFMRAQKAKLKEVQNATAGPAVHFNMYISFKLITFFIADMIHGRELAAHYKKHPPYKNPFKPTKDEINKVYANDEKGKASFLKMLSQSSIPNQNPFEQELPIKWNNPNNMERNINPVLQPGAHKKHL